MTPRERGEAILAAMPPYTWTRPLLPIFEAAIIADRRELLAENEATIEALAKERYRQEFPDADWNTASKTVRMDREREILAALRRLRGVE